MKERIKAKLLSLSKAQLFLVVAIGLIVAVGASAALLQVYVTLTGTATVEQSVVFENGSTAIQYTIGNSPAVAGNTYTQVTTLQNKSEVAAPIEIKTWYNSTANSQWRNAEEGLETKYYGELALENKDGSWNLITTDATKATLVYELETTSFNYELEAEGLSAATEYSLIYYADKQDRFVNYGGDNPGALIVSATTNSEGKISASGSVNLGMNLPAANDWNGTAEANYCVAPDNYDLCRGAKVWLVPTVDYDTVNKKIKDSSWGNMANFLFETDLITYRDADNGGTALSMFTGKMDIYIKNILAVDLMPQTYNVKTEIVPVQ